MDDKNGTGNHQDLGRKYRDMAIRLEELSREGTRLLDEMQALYHTISFDLEIPDALPNAEHMIETLKDLLGANEAIAARLFEYSRCYEKAAAALQSYFDFGNRYSWVFERERSTETTRLNPVLETKSGPSAPPKTGETKKPEE